MAVVSTTAFFYLQLCCRNNIWLFDVTFTTFTFMEKKYTTMKVKVKTLQNFNVAAALAAKHQLEITEEASKDILKKISAKIKNKSK